jgi:O-antigen polymerase
VNNLSHLKLINKLFLILFSLVFLSSVFYSQPNIGGWGLSMTYNIPIWGFVFGTILFAVNVALYKKIWIAPKNSFLIFIVPVLFAVCSLVAGIDQPSVWFFRFCFLIGGLLWLLAFFQFEITNSTINKALLVVIFTSGFQALLGVFQIWGVDSVNVFFPNPDTVPRGNFQQINVQASFLATGIVATFFYISRPCFKFNSTWVKVSIITSVILSFYVLFSSGSRTGLLAILLAIPLIVWSRFSQLKKHRLTLFIIIVGVFGGLFLAQSGIEKTVDKSIKLSEKTYSNARLAMYEIAFNVIKKEPVFGHGIGSFRTQWNKEASKFVIQHPETELPRSINHPHNEFLFWMIEGGLLSVFAILLFLIAIFLALLKCGIKRAVAYTALLIPISLHTQVELPFYISSLHWFLWLFIVFLIFRHSKQKYTFKLSNVYVYILSSITVLSLIVVSLFLINVAKSQKEIYQFVYEPQHAAQPYLSNALTNNYFKKTAEKYAFRAMLYDALLLKDREKVEMFESWAFDYIATRPELKVYQDLVLSSEFLRPQQKGCDAIKAGYQMYAHNQEFKRRNNLCLLEQS